MTTRSNPVRLFAPTRGASKACLNSFSEAPRNGASAASTTSRQARSGYCAFSRAPRATSASSLIAFVSPRSAPTSSSPALTRASSSTANVRTLADNGSRSAADGSRANTSRHQAFSAAASFAAFAISIPRAQRCSRAPAIARSRHPAPACAPRQPQRNPRPSLQARASTL